MNDLTEIYKRVAEFKLKIDYTSNNSTKLSIDNLNKDDLIKRIINGSKDFHNIVLIELFDLSIPMSRLYVDLSGGGYSKKKKGRFKVRA